MSGFGGRRERLPACSRRYIDHTRSKYVRCVTTSAALRCVCIPQLYWHRTLHAYIHELRVTTIYCTLT